VDGGIQYWQQLGQFLQEQKMGRFASDSGGGDFAEAPAGNHIARCVALIDLGTQHGEYQGKPVIRNQVLIKWELCNEHMEDGRPFTVGRFYTNSLSEKSNLRPDLESWRGRPFTPEELVKFDLQMVLGAPCMVQVVHNDKKKARVASIASMPNGMKAPNAVNKPTAFWLDEWDLEAYEALPDGLKKIIQQSDEYKAIHMPVTRETAMEGIQSMQDDCPF
jgi:hypothetical protein